MELRHLRYFTMVAAEGSFEPRCRKLHIAQPPLSRQVQQLEEELGVRLLHRGRPLTLTEPGRYLFEQGRQILQRIDEMRAMTKRIAKGTVLQFNIGFVASTLYDALPELIRRFRIIAPDAEVNLLEMTTLEQVAALKDGRIDIGFGRLRFDDDAIVRRIIRAERLCLVVPRGHKLASKKGKLRAARGRGGTTDCLSQVTAAELCRPGAIVLSRRRHRGKSRYRGKRASDRAGVGGFWWRRLHRACLGQTSRA